MVRWRVLIPVLVLLGLAACGGAPAATVSQPLGGATATVAAAAGGGSAAPSAPSAPTSAAPTAPGAASNTPGVAPTRAATSAPTAATSAGGGAMTTSAAPPPARTAGGTLAPQPGGPVPPGWKIWRGGADFPIVFAYPPDWTVDTSLMADQVIFVGPVGSEEDELIEIINGPQQFDANIDVLRDDFFSRYADFCSARGIEYTERRQLTGATFAILGATCESGGGLLFVQVATGLKGGDEWDITMRTPYAKRDPRLREVFDPLLGSVNVYALIVR